MIPSPIQVKGIFIKKILQRDQFDTDFPGNASLWFGFVRNDFILNGLKCILVEPDCEPTSDKHWYWRARFFGAFPNADWAMLRLGWYVVHIEIDELYGAAESNNRFDLLYSFLTKGLGFDSRCVPVGYSRGGLDVYSWAVKNTDKVYCLYLDNPVCDFKSWHGGKGSRAEYQTAWSNCLNAWGMNEGEALAFPHNPVDNLEPLARANVPILHVYGDADEVVPATENTMLVDARYRALGGEIELICKKGAAHHPHCLENPQPIVDFILKHTT